MAWMQLISQEEGNCLINYYMAIAESYRFGVLLNGEPTFLLKNSNAIIVNADGSVTWKAQETGLGLHSFIELVTGEKTRRKIIIPLCLVNPESRRRLKPLLSTTIDQANGKLNSKNAEFWVSTTEGFGFKVRVPLPNLTIQYVMLQLFPADFAKKFASQYCPFCKDLKKEGRVTL